MRKSGYTHNRKTEKGKEKEVYRDNNKERIKGKKRTVKRLRCGAVLEF